MDDIYGAAKQGKSSTRDLIDFIMTAGDNLYPRVSEAPTQDEFVDMLNLFKKPNIQDLLVYAVRGNHDCMFNYKDEL